MAYIPSSPAKQTSDYLTLLAAPVAINSYSPVVSVDGYNGAQILELVVLDTGVHAVTLTLWGTLDGTNFYVVGMQQVGDQSSGVATPVRVTSTTIASISGTVRQVYQVLDPFKALKLQISSSTLAATGGVTAFLFVEPV